MRADVLEVAQRALAVRRGRVDASRCRTCGSTRSMSCATVRCARRAQRSDSSTERELLHTRRLAAASAISVIGQRKVRRARRRDLRAAIERKGDGAQHGQQIDGRAAVEKQPRRRQHVVDAAAVEDVEVVVELRRAAEEHARTAQIAAALAGSTPRSPPLRRRSGPRDRRRLGASRKRDRGVAARASASSARRVSAMVDGAEDVRIVLGRRGRGTRRSR